MSLLDQVQKVRGETNSVSSTQVQTTSSENNSLLERVQIQRGEIQPTVTQPIIAKPNLIQQAKTAIGSAINKRKVAPINTNISLTGKPGKNIINQIDLGQPGQQQSATLAQPINIVEKKPNKLIKSIDDALLKEGKRIQTDFNSLIGGGVVSNKNQVMPREEYYSEADYQKAIDRTTKKTFLDKINKNVASLIGGVGTTLTIGKLAPDQKILDLMDQGERISYNAGQILPLTKLLTSKAGLKMLAKFVAVDFAISKVFKAVTGKDKFSELLPEGTSPVVTNTVDIIEFLAKGYLAHSIKPGAIRDKFTKQIIDKYDVKPIELSAEQVRDIFQTGKLTTAEQKAIFGKVNTGDVAKQAMKEGITITPEQLLEVRDRPVWAKIKAMFGVAESEAKVLTSREVSFKIGGREVKIDIKQPETLLLGDGTYTPQEVLNKVIGTELQNTTDGKALVKTALEAQKTGSEITIGAKAEIKDLNKTLNESNTEKVIQETKAGEREEYRLDTTENIKKYSQGLQEATPEDTVIVYRAGTGEIGPNEHVTTSEERAIQEYLPNRPGSELIQKEVKLSDLLHSNGPKSEFIYSPKAESTKSLSDYYNSQDQEVFGQSHFEVMSELDVAEAGKRLFNENGEIIGGQDSTFPDWIPSELRLKPLLEGALKDLSDPTNMVFPPNSQPRKQALYEEILREIDSRSGTDSSPIIESIKNAKETKATTTKETTNEVAKTPDRSAQGTEGTTGTKEIENLDPDVAVALKKAKGLSADDIIKQNPDLNLKRDVPVTDIYGNKSVIPEGEALTPYELKGNKVLLQDGETYIVSKNQYQNIKGQSINAEAKEFAPELKTTEETVMGNFDDNLNKKQYADLTKEIKEKYKVSNPLDARDRGLLTDEEKSRLDKLTKEYSEKPKYSNYTLPGGENYKEILIKSPDLNDKKLKEMGYQIEKGMDGEVSIVKDDEIVDFEELPLDIQNFINGNGQPFKSGHWNEPNVIAHLRINERKFNDKPVTFMEELQSDWAREGRNRGFLDQNLLNPDSLLPKNWRITFNGDTYKVVDENGKEVPNKLGDGTAYGGTKNVAIGKAVGEEKLLGGSKQGVPNNPLLKNWQELAVKRALQEAVANGSEYFAWINGDQTSARYNLSTMVDNVSWSTLPEGNIKDISITSKNGQLIYFTINESGKIVDTYTGADKSWKNKGVDEVLGKGLADKIMAKDKDVLEAEGLKFGGEWANNLYDKQVKTIVKKLTGADAELLDMGLPINKSNLELFTIATGRDVGAFVSEKDLKVGLKITDQQGVEYIVTQLLQGNDFKVITTKKYSELQKNAGPLPMDEVVRRTSLDAKVFKLRPPEIKSPGQQAIKITPEIKAIINGEAPQLKKPSGKDPFPLKEVEPPVSLELIQAVEPLDQPTTLPTKQPVSPTQKATKTEPTKITKEDVARTPEQLAQTLEPSTEDIPHKDGYSRLQERLEEQLLDANGQKYNWDETKKTYDKISLKADAEKAIDLLEKNPEKALRIANGFEDPGEKDPVLLDVMNAVALKAFDEGNVELGTRMVNKASLTATRYGQNIASLRGNFNNNSPQNFIKQVISARMDKLGSSSLAEVEKLIGKKSSAKTKATTKIDLEVEKLKKKVDRKLKLKENKIKLAQDIIESLKCK